MGNITRIRTGFLTGNFDDPIDADATAAAWRLALENAFPGAEIEVDYENAQGSKPSGPKTLVEFDNGETEHESDGLHGCCEEIACILEKVDPVWA